MAHPSSFAKQLREFPAVLQELVEAELAAGNTLVEIKSGFPAPPAGAFARLANAITTRARVKTATLDFYDRANSIYSGEWTDAKRFYFVLEPPYPPPPEKDMDAIRAIRSASTGLQPGADVESALVQGSKDPQNSLVARFAESMAINYEKWHDGIGYDLTLIKAASPSELKSIEALLRGRGAQGWRDVEALAAVGTASAHAALREAFATGDAEIRGAVLRYAPDLVDLSEKLQHLRAALRTAEFHGGLSEALEAVAGFHPPEIMAELFRGVRERSGSVAVHFAAMLMYIHGQAAVPFDWEQRPFFLRFNTDHQADREAALAELGRKLGVEPNQ